MSFRIRPKQSLFWVCFGSSKQLTKANFLREFILVPKHFWATIGPWRLRNWWLCSGTTTSLTCIFFPPVRFSFNGGQAGEQYTVAQLFWTSFCPQTKNENELHLKYIWPLIECVSRLSQDLLLCTLQLMHVSKQTIQIYIYLPIFHLTLYYIQPF